MPETTQLGHYGDDEQYEGSLKANTILMNRYRILGVIGGGGMGTVYQARDTRFVDAKRLVAVKEMMIQGSTEAARQQSLRNFKRESEILAALSHSAIPKIFDVFDDNDRAYIIMELVNGSDLELVLNKTKELPVDKILEWSIDLCDVLSYLHGHTPSPIIFRDMKPANVMIDSLGKVRLIDFGIAKQFVVDGKKHTMIGTEGYSAPEQYKGEVTPVSDIYGLGATLHHILTRKDPRLEPPFSFNERPILELNPKCPPALAMVVEKALQNKPEDRYPTCADMRVALVAVQQRQNMPSVSAMPAPGNASVPSVGPALTSFFDDMAQPGAIEPRWKFATEDEVRCSPAAHNGFAFVGSYDTNMWAVNLQDGKQMWKYHTEGGIASSPVVDTKNNLVMFGSEDMSFRALDYRKGTWSWDFKTKGRIRSSGRLAHDHVFFGSDDGKIYALLAINGRQLWEYDLGSPVRVRPFVTNDLVIAGSDDGELVALELSGKRKWGTRVKRGINSSPYVDPKENLCYFGAFDGFMYALDASSGYSVWRFRTNGPIISSPAAADGMIYFGSADGFLYAVSADSAKERWKFNAEKPIVGSPIVHQHYVYFGGTNGFFYCLDAKTGREQWKFETKGQIVSTPFVIENMILIASMDRTLYALPLVG
ncbi:MAG: PQQ-binding-like beta-propeller repeat protein [Armatimonadetes bacterium]|nr:PQQ-binding-like beta-propeller repeat protein [Anaerolineae bacterium]